jgi:hypothetical protein
VSRGTVGSRGGAIRSRGRSGGIWSRGVGSRGVGSGRVTLAGSALDVVLVVTGADVFVEDGAVAAVEGVLLARPVAEVVHLTFTKNILNHMLQLNGTLKKEILYRYCSMTITISY